MNNWSDLRLFIKSKDTTGPYTTISHPPIHTLTVVGFVVDTSALTPGPLTAISRKGGESEAAFLTGVCS
ncbi:hypothetical protein AMECASPLE_002778 [Ameca splendens]|uniref:Uncharacterized protein n=1 Tax=Ameca splendens TaxID=208324 RepID=A0ABV0Z9F9_9TELE